MTEIKSKTIAMLLWPGEKVAEGIEIGNAWATAPVVWDAMCKKHLGLENFAALMKRDRNMGALWKLTQNPRIPDAQRAVLSMTGDNFMIQRFAYLMLAGRIEEFNLQLKDVIGERKNGMAEIAAYLKMGPKAPCVGFWWTDASPNPWLTMNWKKAWTLYKRKPNGGGK